MQQPRSAPSDLSPLLRDGRTCMAVVVVLHLAIAIALLAGLDAAIDARHAQRSRDDALRMAQQGGTVLVGAERLAVLIGASVELLDEARHRDLPLDRAMHLRLRDIARGTPDIEDIHVIAADGALLATSLAFPTPTLSIATSPRFRVLAGGHPGPFLTEPFVGRLSGRTLLSIGVPMRGRDGRFGGAVFVSIAADALRTPPEPLHRRDGRIGAWLSPDGWTLGASRDGAAPARLDPQGASELLAGGTGEAALSVARSLFGLAPRSLAVATLPDWPVAAVAARRDGRLDRDETTVQLLILLGFGVAVLVSVRLAAGRVGRG